jgi:large subunit ribosomal protein L17
MRGLSRSLITHGRVVTTEAKAKRLRPYVEKLITTARKGGLHRRRKAQGELGDKRTVHRLFVEVAPRTGDRPGGYTRILKLGPRRGDAAPMAIIELVDAPAARAPEPEPDRKRPRRRRLRRGGEAAPHDDHEGHEHEAEAETETQASEEPQESDEA